MRVALIAAVCVLTASSCGGDGLTAAERLGQQLARARNSEEIASILARYQGKGGEESLLASSFCGVVTSEINDGSIPDGTDWVQMLVTKGVAIPDVQDTVDRLSAGLTLAAQTNPRVAQRYWQACSPLAR